jgi:hypothetical protein
VFHRTEPLTSWTRLFGPQQGGFLSQKFVDGAERDGSLKAVGGTHGVSPYWHNGTMGVHPACFFIDRAGKVATPERNLAGKHSSHLVYLSLLLRINWRAPGFFFNSLRVFLMKLILNLVDLPQSWL